MWSLLSNRTNTNTLITSVKIQSVYHSASLIAQDISFQLSNKRRSFNSLFSKIVNSRNQDSTTKLYSESRGCYVHQISLASKCRKNQLLLVQNRPKNTSQEYPKLDPPSTHPKNHQTKHHIQTIYERKKAGVAYHKLHSVFNLFSHKARAPRNISIRTRNSSNTFIQVLAGIPIRSWSVNHNQQRSTSNFGGKNIAWRKFI